MTAQEQRLVRSQGRVVRLTAGVALVAFNDWRGGQILVPVDAETLQRALGLSRDGLLGACATAVIRPDALLDTEVQPQAWKAVPNAGPRAA